MADNKSNGLAKADELANGLTSDLANDNEIIKALECCLCADTVMECHKCTYIGENNCLNSMITDVLELINRQKAEIERLKKDLHGCVREVSRSHEIDRNKGIREFAERLKETIDGKSSGYLFIPEKRFDNLVAELTESEKLK